MAKRRSDNHSPIQWSPHPTWWPRLDFQSPSRHFGTHFPRHNGACRLDLAKKAEIYARESRASHHAFEMSIKVWTTAAIGCLFNLWRKVCRGLCSRPCPSCALKAPCRRCRGTTADTETQLFFLRVRAAVPPQDAVHHARCGFHRWSACDHTQSSCVVLCLPDGVTATEAAAGDNGYEALSSGLCRAGVQHPQATCELGVVHPANMPRIIHARPLPPRVRPSLARPRNIANGPNCSLAPWPLFSDLEDAVRQEADIQSVVRAPLLHAEDHCIQRAARRYQEHARPVPTHGQGLPAVLSVGRPRMLIVGTARRKGYTPVPSPHRMSRPSRPHGVVAGAACCAQS